MLNCERLQATKRTVERERVCPNVRNKGGRGDGEMLENRTNKVNQCLCTLPDAKVIKGKQSQIPLCNNSSPDTTLFFFFNKLKLLCFNCVNNILRIRELWLLKQTRSYIELKVCKIPEISVVIFFLRSEMSLWHR